MGENNKCVHINSDIIYNINFKDLSIECCYCFDNPVILYLLLISQVNLELIFV